MNYTPRKLERYLTAVGVALFVVILSSVTFFLRLEHQGSTFTLATRTLKTQMPMYFLFGLLALISNVWISGLVVVLLAIILNLANNVKYALVNEVLSFNDLMQVQEHFSVIKNYMNIGHVLLIFILILFLVLAIYQSKNFFKSRKSPWQVFFLVTLCLLTLPSFYPRFPTKIFSDHISPQKFLTAFFRDYLGIRYRPWVWYDNYLNNGLYFHLIQSSSRHLPSEPTQENIKQMEGLKPVIGSDDSRPKHVVFILCEACWYQKGIFEKEFSPVLDLPGIQKTTVVSPSYGGRTVNAAFEILTALPSRGLVGIIYPEYADYFSEHANTLVQSFKTLGYQTYDIHNYKKIFWRRTKVLPKFGFDRFYSIEDMDYKGKEKYPEDSALFDFSLDLIRKKIDSNLFLHLETVHTHGNFDNDGDHGEKDYATRLSLTMLNLKKFIVEVKKLDPEIFIVLYGDHKPALTKFFYDQGVFSSKMFKKTGERDTDFIFSSDADRSIIGSVPMLIYYPANVKIASKLAQKIDHQPMFCASSILDQDFFKTGYVGTAWSKGICEKDILYSQKTGLVPSWVYSYLLF